MIREFPNHDVSMSFTTLAETGWFDFQMLSFLLPDFGWRKTSDQGGNVCLLLAVLAVLHSLHRTTPI